MDGRQLFGAIVRTVGLGFVILQLYQLIQIIPALTSGNVPMSQQVAIAVIMPLLWIAIGLLIMRRGDVIVNFAYPAPRSAAPAARAPAAKSARKS